MSEESFAARWEKGRLFDVTLQGCKFYLRRPTAHQFRNAYESNRVLGTDDQLYEAKVARALVEPALLGWSGVTQKTISPDDGTLDPLPFTVENKELFLNERTDLVDLLGVEIVNRHREQRDKLEEAAKNSLSVSTGS